MLFMWSCGHLVHGIMWDIWSCGHEIMWNMRPFGHVSMVKEFQVSESKSFTFWNPGTVKPETRNQKQGTRNKIQEPELGKAKPETESHYMNHMPT